MVQRLLVLLATAMLLAVSAVPAMAQVTGYETPDPTEGVTTFPSPPPSDPPSEPPVTEPPVTEPPPVVPPFDPPPPDDPPSLAATGGSLWGGLAAGAVFVVGGAGMVAFSRRRRQL